MQQPALPFDAAPDSGSGRVLLRSDSGPDPETLAAPAQRVHPALIFVRHPRARRYIVSVRPDGAVRVTVPRRGSKREAEAFATSQREWIARQLRRLEEGRAAAPVAELSAAELRAAQARARRELPPRLLELAARYGLAVSRVSIRNQRSRWGSCSRAGHICLNWRLVQMPAWVRDYVMVHELMHLQRMDHSRRFWRLVAAVCPEYLDARKWLREHATTLG